MKVRALFQFGLLSLLLAVTLFAVVCSAWRSSPHLGIIATIAVLYGVLGMWHRSLTEPRRSESLSYGEKLRAFFHPAMAVVVGAIISALIFVAVVLLIGALTR